MKNIVSAKWLKENIDNEELVILDCRFSLMHKNYSIEEYSKEHIKGAIRVDVEKELSDIVKVHGGRHPLPQIESLKNTIQGKGITSNSIVVVYDDGDLSGASRLWWILKYTGHNNTFVLDGGIQAFKNIGGETNNIVPITNQSKYNINLKNDLMVDMNYVKKKLFSKNTIIIDSREEVRYRGEFEPVDIKKGHIPSAKNSFWMNVFDKEDNVIKLKSHEEIKEMFININKSREVILYCGSGITACVNSLALSEIGIESKLYAGSFSDWISYSSNDIVTLC